MCKELLVPEGEMTAARAAAGRVREEIASLGLTYHIESYGCQMNDHDSEKLAGHSGQTRGLGCIGKNSLAQFHVHMGVCVCRK